jgi:hypothetical protein
MEIALRMNEFASPSFCRRRVVMHKDVTYTFRLDSRMNAVLNVATRRDRRTVASLMAKLIAVHLTKEGFMFPDEGGPGGREGRA